MDVGTGSPQERTSAKAPATAAAGVTEAAAQLVRSKKPFPVHDRTEKARLAHATGVIARPRRSGPKEH